MSLGRKLFLNRIPMIPGPAQLSEEVRRDLFKEYHKLSKKTHDQLTIFQVKVLSDYLEWLIAVEGHHYLQFSEPLTLLYLKWLILANVEYSDRKKDRLSVIYHDDLDQVWKALELVAYEIGGCYLSKTNIDTKIELVQLHLENLRAGLFEDSENAQKSINSILHYIDSSTSRDEQVSYSNTAIDSSPPVDSSLDDPSEIVGKDALNASTPQERSQQLYPISSLNDHSTRFPQTSTQSCEKEIASDQDRSQSQPNQPQAVAQSTQDNSTPSIDPNSTEVESNSNVSKVQSQTTGEAIPPTQTQPIINTSTNIEINSNSSSLEKTHQQVESTITDLYSSQQLPVSRQTHLVVNSSTSVEESRASTNSQSQSQSQPQLENNSQIIPGELRNDSNGESSSSNDLGLISNLDNDQKLRISDFVKFVRENGDKIDDLKKNVAILSSARSVFKILHEDPNLIGDLQKKLGNIKDEIERKFKDFEERSDQESDARKSEIRIFGNYLDGRINKLQTDLDITKSKNEIVDKLEVQMLETNKRIEALQQFERSGWIQETTNTVQTLLENGFADHNAILQLTERQAFIEQNHELFATSLTGTLKTLTDAKVANDDALVHLNVRNVSNEQRLEALATSLKSSVETVAESQLADRNLVMQLTDKHTSSEKDSKQLHDSLKELAAKLASEQRHSDRKHRRTDRIISDISQKVNTLDSAVKTIREELDIESIKSNSDRISENILALDYKITAENRLLKTENKTLKSEIQTLKSKFDAQQLNIDANFKAFGEVIRKLKEEVQKKNDTALASSGRIRRSVVETAPANVISISSSDSSSSSSPTNLPQKRAATFASPKKPSQLPKRASFTSPKHSLQLPSDVSLKKLKLIPILNTRHDADDTTNNQ